MIGTNLIKPNSDGSIEINNKFKPNRVLVRLINKLSEFIMNSELAKSYDMSHQSQKYTLKYIATKIIYFLHHCTSTNWRALGSGWENIYSHFRKWTKWKIIDNVFMDLYKTKRSGYLKVIMTDTSFILNKNGSDCIKRNPLVKNKNCTKLFNIVDDKGVSIFVEFCPGSMYDSKCLMTFLAKFLSENIGITTFLADSGFYTTDIMNLLKEYDVKPLIAKNVRNSKKHKNKVNKKGKKIKLTYAQKIARQLEDMTKQEKRFLKNVVKSRILMQV